MEISISSKPGLVKMENSLTDSIGRKIDYLRVAVTDRCNLRCVYCIPEEGVPLLNRNEMLTYEEIVGAVGLLTDMGITKVRITGGEPLARKDIINLISRIGKIEKLENVSLTTNGIFLSGYVKELKNYGIKGINISIDSLNPKKYNAITRGGNLKAVLDSLEACMQAGFGPIKINTVLSGYIDKQDVEDLIKFGIDKPVDIRFIEMMNPVYDDPANRSATGKVVLTTTGQTARSAVNTSFQPAGTRVTAEDIFGIMGKYGNYQRLTERIGFGPSIYYKIDGSKGAIGFIRNNTEACSFCNRIRLTPTGRLRLCLFSDMEFNLRDMLRNDIPPEEIKKEISEFIKAKPQNREAGCRLDSGSHLRLNEFMNKIGG
jgi:cyclic pyranopterin phosphate synthase